MKFGGKEKKEKEGEGVNPKTPVIKPGEPLKGKVEDLTEEEKKEEFSGEDFAKLNEFSHVLSRSEALATEMTYHEEFMNPERYGALNLLALSADFLKLRPDILNGFLEYVEAVREAEEKVIEKQKKEEHEVG